ncbi:MAG: hypothetical protein ACYS17_14390 [Planctomycetota bacterium]|jgi:hypothetical protein
MSFNVYYDSERDCVFVSIEGDFDIEQAKQLAQVAVKQINTHNCKRLINDLRRANLKFSTIEIYELPTYLLNAGLDQLCKRALIVSKDFDDFRFFENVSFNNGHLVKVFVDSDESSNFESAEKAKEWLGLGSTNN